MFSLLALKFAHCGPESRVPSQKLYMFFHLDVFIIMVLMNIIGMTTQNQQENVVLILNVYAKQKHVPTVLPVHIKTNQVLRLRVKPVQLEKYLQKAQQHVTIYKICYKMYNH